MTSSTTTLIEALRVLARSVNTEDGVISACLGEAADRLHEMLGLIDGVYEVVELRDVGDSPYNKKWKSAWLEKARKCGATPIP